MQQVRCDLRSPHQPCFCLCHKPPRPVAAPPALVGRLRPRLEIERFVAPVACSWETSFVMDTGVWCRSPVAVKRKASYEAIDIDAVFSDGGVSVLGGELLGPRRPSKRPAVGGLEVGFPVQFL